jgi:hypothetical protein
MTFVPIVFVGIVIIAVLVVTIRKSREADAAWARAADELGLDFVAGGLSTSRWMQGEKDGIAVEVRGSEGKNAATCFKITPPGLSRTLAVRAEGTWTNLGKVFSGEDVLLQDPDFDRLVNIHGVEEEIVALMDVETRADVMELVGLGGTIGEGTITLRRTGVIREKEELVHLASLLARLGRRLSGGPVPALLLENAQSDPLVEVRVRNLEILARNYAYFAEAKTAAAMALEDRSPRVRMLGAVLDKGEVGIAVLQALVQDSDVPGDVRAASLEHLASSFSYNRAKPVVAGALESADDRLARAAVVAVGQAKDVEEIQRIVAIATERDALLCEAVATTLGQLGDAFAEGVLIKLLGREEPAIRVAAAKALGLVGTVHAVEPLLPLTKELLGALGLRAAALDAVRSIQARLGDAEAGRVSVAKVEDVAGAVSLAADGGELSLPPDKEREPSR